MSIEIQAMDSAALAAAKADRVAKAEELIKAAQGRAGSDGDAYRELNADERDRFKALMGDAQNLETEIARRKESDGMRAFVENGIRERAALAAMPTGDEQPGDASDGGTGRAMSPGTKFVTSPIYQKLLKQGAFNHEPNSGLLPEFSVALGFRDSFPVHKALLLRDPQVRKDLLYTGAAVGGAFVIPEYQLDAESAARPTPDVLSMLPVQRTGSDTIYWIQQDTRSSAATTVSQATTVTGTEGQKPETALAWSRQSTAVQTIAVNLPVTNQQLGDAAEIRGVIDGELRSDLELQLDYQALQGDGTAPNLTGILNASIQSLTYATATHDNLADALLFGVVQVMTANEPEPTGIGLNPIQWRVFSTLKTSGSGEYIAGPPTTGGPRSVWGYPMFVSNRLPNQTALIGAFNFARLHMREEASVKVGFVNDDFINNRVRILAEMRGALTVRRPNAFVKVTSLPTS